MALTDSQRAAYDTLVAQGRQEFADQFAAAMTAVNAGVPVQQATQAAFSAPAPVSNQAVASWLQANPGASDATIASAMQQYGVSPAQMAAVTGIPESQIAARVAAVTGAAPANFVNPLNNLGAVNNTALATGLSGGDTSIPGVTNTLEKLTSQIQRINTALDNKNWTGSWRGDSNAAVNAAAEILSSKGVSDLSNLTVVPAEVQEFVSDEYGGSYTNVPGFNLVDKNTGQVISTSRTKDFVLDNYDTGNIFKSNDKSFGITVTEEGVPVPYRTTEKGGIGKTALAFGATVLGAPYVSGLLASAAPATFAAGTAANAAATGALLGGGGAALTGNDILKGALLGAGAGYLGNKFMGGTTATGDSIYSLANGTPNLDYMGGGQGLTSTGAANLPSMGGAQGLQIYAGVPSTTLAEALSSFAGVNPGVLADMGIGQGITYATPSGLVTENGTIITGDIISELGKNTGFDLPKWLNENVGAGIGDRLGKVETGIGGGSPVIGVPLTNTPPIMETLTPGKVVDAIKLGGLVAGTVGGANAVSQTPAGFPIVPVPSDWRTPTYGQTGAWPALRPIDFGSRELLRGTQWEQYLNPQEAIVAPTPQFSMGFDSLMNSLNGRQAGALTLNDIISGIQSQYGQTNPGTVG